MSPGTGWEGVHLGCASACCLADGAHGAHLCLLLLAVGLLPHLLQVPAGPGELLLQLAPLRFSQRQGLA